jgi:hypothetical protein
MKYAHVAGSLLIAVSLASVGVMKLVYHKAFKTPSVKNIAHACAPVV